MVKGRFWHQSRQKPPKAAKSGPKSRKKKILSKNVMRPIKLISGTLNAKMYAMGAKNTFFSRVKSGEKLAKIGRPNHRHFVMGVGEEGRPPHYIDPWCAPCKRSCCHVRTKPLLVGAMPQVQVTTVDDHVRPSQRAWLLHADVQGHELHGFCGASALFGAAPPLHLHQEFWPAGMRNAGYHPLQLLDFLEAHGYVCWMAKEKNVGQKVVRVPCSLPIFLRCTAPQSVFCTFFGGGGRGALSEAKKTLKT